MIKQAASEPTDSTLWRSLIDHAPVGLAIWDARAHVKAANKLFAQMLRDSGLHEGPRAPDEIPRWLHEKMSEKIGCHEDLLADIEFDLEMPRAGKWADDQRTFRFFCFRIPSPIKTGALIGCGVLDVTDKRRVTQVALDGIRKQQQYIRLQREFMTQATHELRTPLAALRSAANMLQEGYSRSDMQRVAWCGAIITETVAHLVRLTEGFYVVNQLALAPAPRYRQIDVRAWARAAASRFDPPEPGASRVKLSVAKGTPETVAADSARLDSIVENLLSNALKYSAHNQDVRLVVSTRGPFLVVEVRDRGIGVTAEDAPRVFEPFFRGHNIGETNGNGLGLKIAFDAAELLKGALSFRANPGGGTIFELRLPLEVDR